MEDFSLRELLESRIGRVGILDPETIIALPPQGEDLEKWVHNLDPKLCCWLLSSQKLWNEYAPQGRIPPSSGSNN